MEHQEGRLTLQEVTKLRFSGIGWEAEPEGVRAPYAKSPEPSGVILSTTGHANPVGSRVVHDPRLNIPVDR